MKLKALYAAIIAIMISCAPIITFAQDESEVDMDQPADIPEAPQDVPVDGGLSILLAAGVGYVAKKGFERKKQQQQSL